MNQRNLFLVVGTILLFLFFVSLVRAQDAVDCSNKPCDVTCPRRTTYRSGNNCTDACDTTYCETTQTCGCYCRPPFKKVNGECKMRLACPRNSSTTEGSSDGTTTGLASGTGTGTGGGLAIREIITLLQNLIETIRANRTST